MQKAVRQSKIAPKRGHMKSMNVREQFQLWGFAAIPVFLVLLFNYVPMFGVIIAFKNYKYNLGIFASKWVGFDNFKFFFSSADFFRITRNTLGLNMLFIVAGMIASIFVAVLLYELAAKRMIKVFQTVFIIPYFLSCVIVSYMSYAFLNPSYGFINNMLVSLGMEKVDWYSSPQYWPAILTIVFIWKNVGMDSVVYYAALMGMDNTLLEAAEIDGANRRCKITKIMIPQLMPIITILFIMKVGNIFRADFGLFYQTTRNVGTLYPTTDVIDTYIFRAMREIGDMGMASAVGLLQSVVGLVTVLAVNFTVKKIEPDYRLF